MEDDNLLLEQKLEHLSQAGCKQVFVDNITIPKNTRPGLDDAILYARENDILVVCNLKDLISGVRQFKSVMERLSESHIELKVLEGGLDDIKTDKINNELILKASTLLAEIQGRFISETNERGAGMQESKRSQDRQAQPVRAVGSQNCLK